MLHMGMSLGLETFVNHSISGSLPAAPRKESCGLFAKKHPHIIFTEKHLNKYDIMYTESLAGFVNMITASQYIKLH